MSPRLLIWVAVAFVVALAATARAEPAFPEPSQAEREAIEAADASDYVTARERARQVLADDPESIFGLAAQAEVAHYEDANNPRALHLVRRALERVEDRYGDTPSGHQAIQWHARLLRKQARLLGEMDRRAEQLEALDAYERKYDPKQPSSRAWALMKLGRFDEARSVARTLLDGEEFWQRVSGWNNLMVAYSEQGDDERAWKIGQEGFEALGSRSCLLAYNTSLNALDVLEFERAVALANAVNTAEVRDCPSSGYSLLASLYAVKGEFQKALTATRKQWEHPMAAHMRQQFRMSRRGRLMELLLLLGRFDDALRLATERHEQPDRGGFVSSSAEERRLGEYVEYWIALDAHMEQARERASARSFGAAIAHYQAWSSAWLRRWEASQLVVAMAADEVRLADTLRPYSGSVSPWAAGSLARIFGPGIVDKIVWLSRRKHAAVADKASGYFELLLGEAAWGRGDDDRAVELAERGLEALPRFDALVRWRSQAWYADALRNVGRDDDAQVVLHDVIREFPTALRLLSVRIPVVLRSEGAPLAKTVAERLESSPRLDVGESGFEVRVIARSERVTVCLFGAGGFRYDCAEVESKDDDDDTVAAAIDSFHDQIFAPKIELTQMDLNSLDGSPTRIRAEDAIESVLGAGAP